MPAAAVPGDLEEDWASGAGACLQPPRAMADIRGWCGFRCRQVGRPLAKGVLPYGPVAQAAGAQTAAKYWACLVGRRRGWLRLTALVCSKV